MSLTTLVVEDSSTSANVHLIGFGKEIGKFTRAGNRNNPVIIATDKSGYVPEIVTWENGRVLGVQFHPEIFMDA